MTYVIIKCEIVYPAAGYENFIISSWFRMGLSGRAMSGNIKAQNRASLVLTCKDKLVDYYAKFGFVNEGKSEKSQHGGVSWNQMRLTF